MQFNYEQLGVAYVAYSTWTCQCSRCIFRMRQRLLIGCQVSDYLLLHEVFHQQLFHWSNGLKAPHQFCELRDEPCLSHPRQCCLSYRSLACQRYHLIRSRHSPDNWRLRPHEWSQARNSQHLRCHRGSQSWPHSHQMYDTQTSVQGIHGMAQQMDSLHHHCRHLVDTSPIWPTVSELWVVRPSWLSEFDRHSHQPHRFSCTRSGHLACGLLIKSRLNW